MFWYLDATMKNDKTKIISPGGLWSNFSWPVLGERQWPLLTFWHFQKNRSLNWLHSHRLMKIWAPPMWPKYLVYKNRTDEQWTGFWQITTKTARQVNFVHFEKKKNWDRREEEVDRTTWDLMDGGLSRTSKRAAEMMKTRLWLFCINILWHQPEKLFLLAFFLL